MACQSEFRWKVVDSPASNLNSSRLRWTRNCGVLEEETLLRLGFWAIAREDIPSRLLSVGPTTLAPSLNAQQNQDVSTPRCVSRSLHRPLGWWHWLTHRHQGLACHVRPGSHVPSSTKFSRVVEQPLTLVIRNGTELGRLSWKQPYCPPPWYIVFVNGMWQLHFADLGHVRRSLMDLYWQIERPNYALLHIVGMSDIYLRFPWKDPSGAHKNHFQIGRCTISFTEVSSRNSFQFCCQ